MEDKAVAEKREYLFDNIKGFIIFLVVWEHFAGVTIRSGSLAGDLLCTAVLLFHMSVMMFVSGYFSKNLGRRNMEYNIRKVLIPYMLITVLVALGEWVVSGRLRLKIFSPGFALWYMLVLFLFRMLLPYLTRVRHVILLSFLVALLSGMFPDVERFSTLGRAFTNLPFFLLGYYCSGEHVEKLRNWMKRPERIIYTTAFVILTFGSAGMAIQNDWDANVYRNNTTYAAAGMSNLLGMECRLLFYLIGCFAILCFLACFSRKRTFLSRAGKNSMVVYFFHIFVYRLIDHIPYISGGSLLNFILVTLLSVATVWLLSMDIWSKIFHIVVNFLGDFCFGKQKP